VSQTVELPRAGGPGSVLGGAWKVIVRNDDHNTFDHVATTLAGTIANVIHTSGRAIVYSGQQEPAEHYWEQLKSAGLTMAPLEQD
jgi:ATP-dependent Clp protease adaptor protein ClpS